MGYSQLLLVALQVANTLVVEHRETMLNWAQSFLPADQLSQS